MYILHTVTGIFFSLLSVLTLYFLDAVPRYVREQGYLLEADSIFTKIPIWLPSLGMLIVWGIAGYVIWRYIKKIYNIPLYNFWLVAQMMGAVTVLYLIADHVIQQRLILFCTALVMFYLYGVVRDHKDFTTHKMKSYRRLAMMLWVFVVYAVSSFFYALGVFFQDIPFWTIAMFLAVLLATYMFFVWRMYITISLKENVFWFVIIALFLFEIIWVFKLFPFAHTTLGFFVAWSWYIIQLFLRFHFTSQGLEWKKQRGFMLTNLLIFVMILLLSQWR